MEASASAANRRLLKRSIIRIKDYVNEWSRANVNDSIERLELLIPELNSLSEKFYTSIQVAFQNVDQTNAAEAKKAEDELFKEQDDIKILVLVQHAKINGLLKNLNPPSRDSLLNESINANSSNAPPAPDICLPKIEIPEFDGDPRKFMKFKSMFQNMIHDEPRITNVRKLVYLQKALVGKAEEFFRDVDIIDAAAYPTIWREFLQRYDNKRVIIRAHFSDLFAIKQIKDESGLRKMLDAVTSSIRGLKICGENPDQWSSILCYLVSTKLDEQTKRDFENLLTDKATFPSFDQLKKFLEGRAAAADDRSFISREKPKPNKPSNPEKSEVSKKSFIAAVNKCVACSSQHLLLECKVFLSKTPFERFELIKKNRLCINCFGKNHVVSECRNRACKTCNQKHHTMLHIEKSTARPVSSPAVSAVPSNNADSLKQPESMETKNVFTTILNNEVVILPTAVVRFRCGSTFGKARILFDPASQATMVSDTLVRRYHLPTTQSLFVSAISGVGDGPTKSDRSCSLTLLSRFSQFQLPIICDIVPPTTIKYEVSTASLNLLKSKVDYVQYADESLPYRHADIILSAKYVESCLLNQTINIGEATLRNSVFGWIAIGAVPSDTTTPNLSNISYAVSYHSTISTIESKLQKMLASEEFDEPVNSQDEHIRCNQHFESTYQRNEKGNFVVFLPRKEDPSNLSDSRKMALSSLAKIERASPAIQAEYHHFIEEYERLNHLTFVEPAAYQTSSNYILPLLLVLRPDKSTTKLRVVFNASYKTRVGKSLNDILMVGPVLQLDLFDIILRFRRHPIAFAADIEKMYRQILVHPDDQHLQKIFYRPPSSKLKVGILQTVTYGTAPASFITTKCLFVLADEIQSANPRCADIIRHDFYMDDLITGGDTVDDAINLQTSIGNKLASAQFRLRKYCSNSNEFLQNLDPSIIEPLDYRDITLGNVKILGIKWVPSQDNLGITLKVEALPTTITKRIMLSEIASIFDVLGILSPVTIRSKLLMQELWREKIEWDSPIPSKLESSFRNYYGELADLRTFTFPRHYKSVTSSQPYELIGFCDASDQAYCAVIYIRTAIPNAAASFVCAKTKVAPLKQPTKPSPTIPRLELQAAVLLARLIDKVVRVFGKQPGNTFTFSDSTVVLSWLNKPPSTWKQYVSNRVMQIASLLPDVNWRYVNTKENPADVATRGISAKQFLSNKLWLTGPQFINHEMPPPFKSNESSSDVLKEQRLPKLCHATTASIDCSLLTKFSSYQHLVAVFAYIRRFAENSRNTNLRSARPQVLLSPEELVNSKTALIQYTQRSFYLNEICSLETSCPLPPKSSLLSLSPFLDAEGVLRVGSRLRKSSLSFAKKHPIILPARSPFVELWVRHLHLRYFHATKSFIINFVNTEFWTVGSLSNVVKKVIHHCVTCTRYRGETMQQIMGQLPAVRITECNTFSHTGVDFAGPFECKCTGHRTTKTFKVYIAIFVCLTSRAVHIKIVSNLTTVAFLDALKRFIARRGLPTTIMSDNGRNFVGAKNYLDLKAPNLATYALSEGISWKFIPPRAPNHGGIWEAAVKSAKHHFRRVIGAQALTFEEYHTFFSQTEAILNSRPLCYRRSDDKSYVAITPAHLAIGRPLLIAIDGEPPQSASTNARYALRENLVRSFWSTWRNDYLNQLQAKFKWCYAQRNLQRGDVVLIKEDNLLPNAWPLAVVDDVLPDDVGNVRVVHLRSTQGPRTRSVRQLIPLCLDEPGGSSPGEYGSPTSAPC